MISKYKTKHLKAVTEVFSVLNNRLFCNCTESDVIWMAKNKHIWVYKNKNSIIGAACIEIHKKTKEIDIEALAVSKNKQRRGVGSKMLRAIENYAKRLGIKTITLGSHKIYRAKKFYIKNGYSLVGVDQSRNYIFNKALHN